MTCCQDQDSSDNANQWVLDGYYPDHIHQLVEEMRIIVVHEFSIGDVEEPDLYAAQPLYNWEKSQQGQWIMANAVETPSWHRLADSTLMGYKYQIRAKLQGVKLTEWLLRYGHDQQ